PLWGGPRAGWGAGPGPIHGPGPAGPAPLGRRNEPAAPGTQPDLVHGILLLVLDTLDEYRRAHFPGP
ncbi:hypothetical protein ABT090_29105, partial [Streptomyces asoensis]